MQLAWLVGGGCCSACCASALSSYKFQSLAESGSDSKWQVCELVGILEGRERRSLLLGNLSISLFSLTPPTGGDKLSNKCRREQGLVFHGP